MLKIAHRGASAIKLENSLEAFSTAIALGARAVELDVQYTSDGQLVVLHDKYLDRTCSTAGPLVNYDSETLREQVKLRNGEPIPFLEEVVALFVDTHIKLYIEIINPAAAFDAYRSASRHLLPGQFIISSFHHRALLELNKSVRVDTMALFECNPIKPIELVKSCGATEAGIAIDSISGEMVKSLQAEGIKCYGYTANHSEDLKLAKALGLDGVFSDHISD